jgi:hypothetical protein
MRVKLSWVARTKLQPSGCSGCPHSVKPVGEVTCSRCHTVLPGSKLPDGGMTAGYYDVRGTNGWADYANPGEQYLCDTCMWADPRYIRDYPEFQLQSGITGRKPVSSTPKPIGFVSVSDLLSPSIRLK